MKTILLLVLVLPLILKGQSIDILLKGGKIVDGTGNSWFYGDIAIRDGKIVSVGEIDGASAKRVLDVKGLIVSPGFIDVDTHIEGTETREPRAGNFILDGVTSVITGNCGTSHLDLAQYFRKLDSLKTSINVASLIGHNTIRKAVMGDVKRDPTDEEQKKMLTLVEQGMKDGAVGLSTGLVFVPGTYAKPEEVISLAKVASQYNGVYASHIRDEGPRVNEAIEEAISVGRNAGISVEISHFKVTNKPNFGKAVSMVAQIEQAREEGIDVTMDQYPYAAASTTLEILVPTWVFSGGKDSVMIRLKNKVTREKIKTEMVAFLKAQDLKDYSNARVANYPADTSLNGKTIPQVNVEKGRKGGALNEAETILEIIEHGSVQMIFFVMDEEDLQHILQYPFTMIGSDAMLIVAGEGLPHPRAYSANARVLGKYTRELKVIWLEEAVRRMTSLPAQKFKIRNRGLLLEGMAADVVVFDERQIADVATFEKPHAHPRGVRYVIVNGQIVVDNGKHNGVRSGQVLKGPGIK